MPRRYPTLYQQRTLWNAATGLSIVCLGALFVGLIWLSGKVFGYLQPVLVPLAVSGIVAYLLDPLVTWMQAKGLSRLRAVIVTFCCFLVAICVAGLVIVPPIARQAGQLVSNKDELGTSALETMRKWSVIKPLAEWSNELVDKDGNLIEKPDPYFEEIEENPKDKDGEPAAVKEGSEQFVTRKGEAVESPTPEERSAAEEHRNLLDASDFTDRQLGHFLTNNTAYLSNVGLNWLKGGTSRILGILGYVIGFAMIPIYLYYFLKESSSIKAHWQDYVPLRASKFKDEVVDCLGEINGYLLAFFRGQVLVAMIDGVLIGIALMIFQVPYALVIGLAMAVLGVIPFIGNILCLVPACIIAFVHFSGSDPNHQWLGDNPWAYVGVVGAIFLIAQQINSLVTAPKIVGDSVGLHPMTVIFSMLFWSIPLGGFLGALLAVPLTAAVKVLIRRYIWERRIMEDPTDPPLEELA
jgi:predicted PurR-regulated permease PerM